ncbi:hypothetical protein BDV96DRAFT_233642 [Lophiotrema nucula]|uniref:Uncharacterized protein n=1 Tax=Lophiotrema nucula TaxID=690887 RepID=A0A6A5YRJ0_9PLEO|nr:hypothetical protein BDV96DRAFT_233642 [Lophiotrema nucula]
MLESLGAGREMVDARSVCAGRHETMRTCVCGLQCGLVKLVSLLEPCAKGNAEEHGRCWGEAHDSIPNEGPFSVSESVVLTNRGALRGLDAVTSGERGLAVLDPLFRSSERRPHFRPQVYHSTVQFTTRRNLCISIILISRRLTVGLSLTL